MIKTIKDIGFRLDRNGCPPSTTHNMDVPIPLSDHIPATKRKVSFFSNYYF